MKRTAFTFLRDLWHLVVGILAALCYLVVGILAALCVFPLMLVWFFFCPFLSLGRDICRSGFRVALRNVGHLEVTEAAK